MIGHRADQFRSFLRATMNEAAVDPFSGGRRRCSTGSRPRRSTPDWHVPLPPHLIVGLADYRIDVEDGPVFLDAEPLWVALDQQEKGEETTGYGGTPIGTLLMELRVHDLAPLKEPLGFIESEVESSLRAPESYRPFTDLILDIRRATDPLGHRWGPGGDGDFHKWLYETNQAGLTRFAHLVWLARPDLMQTFPEVRWDASRLKRWNDVRAMSEFGIDFFDRSVEATASDGKWVPPPHALGRRSVCGMQSPGGTRWLAAWFPDMARESGPGQIGAPKLQHPVRKQPKVCFDRFGGGQRLDNAHGPAQIEQRTGSGGPGLISGPGTPESPLLGARHHRPVPLARTPPTPASIAIPFGAFGELNLIHANAAEFAAPLGLFHHRLGGRFNAAMWFWEGATLPEEWLPAFDRVDELWLASNYLADVFGQYERVPVRVVGLAADLPEPTDASRSMLGLRDDDLVFLFVFDAQSVAERKNPDLALTAFERAFGRSKKACAS